MKKRKIIRCKDCENWRLCDWGDGLDISGECLKEPWKGNKYFPEYYPQFSFQEAGYTKDGETFMFCHKFKKRSKNASLQLRKIQYKK